MVQVSKVKMKWKTIKWLVDNKKESLEKFFKQHEYILSLSEKNNKLKQRGLSKAEFSNLIISRGISNDVDLINKLFWVFDEDGSGDLKYQELVFGLEMFRDSSFETKLKAFFDLCDADSSGAISKKEFSDLLRKNVINNEDKNNIKSIVEKIFKSVKLDANGEITL